MIRGWRRTIWLALGLMMVSLVPTSFVLAAESEVRIGVGDTTVLIHGSTSPQAAVSFIDGTTVMGSTTANAAGEYSQLFTSQPPGIHTYKVYAQDSSGRFTDTVSTEVHVEEHFQTEVEVFLPPTVQLSQSTVQQGDVLTVTGATVPGATVLVYVNGASGSVVAGANGNWRYDFATGGLAAGQHQLYVVATKSGGEQSHASQPRTFTVTVTPTESPPSTPSSTPSPTPEPSQPFLPRPTPTAPSPPSITYPRPGDIISGDTVDVTGTAEPGVRIELLNRGQIVGSTFSGSDGAWRITITLSEYANSLQARACRGTVCSALSGAVQFFHQPLTPGPLLTLQPYHQQAMVAQLVSIKAFIKGGEIPYSVVIEWGDGKRDEVSSKQAELSFTHYYDRPGNYSGRVTVTDRQGHVAVAQFTMEILPRPDQSFWSRYAPWLLLLSLLAIGLLIFRYVKLKLFIKRDRR